MKKLIKITAILSLITLVLVAFTAKKITPTPQATGYKIVEKWELPAILNEVSGIDWIGNNRIAAVQDEDGIIFIYDLNTSKIENRIEFASGGDYEGIRISEKDAYVLRSDGVIFKIENYLDKNKKVSKHPTSLTTVKGVDVEGLELDHRDARFLLAEKERKEKLNSRGIYAVTLNLEKSWDKPVFSIPLDDPVFGASGNKKSKFNPSEIALHPQTGEYYVLDGRNPKLLILQAGGKPEKVINFDENEFAQPEGLTFDEQSNVYISNEAGDNPANILKVVLK